MSYRSGIQDTGLGFEFIQFRGVQTIDWVWSSKRKRTKLRYTVETIKIGDTLYTMGCWLRVVKNHVSQF